MKCMRIDHTICADLSHGSARKDRNGNTYACTALYVQHITPGPKVHGFKMSVCKITVNTSCLGRDGVYKEDLESATSAKGRKLWSEWANPDPVRARMSRETQTWIDAALIKEHHEEGGLLAPGSKDRIMVLFQVSFA